MTSKYRSPEEQLTIDIGKITIGCEPQLAGKWLEVLKRIEDYTDEVKDDSYEAGYFDGADE